MQVFCRKYFLQKLKDELLSVTLEESLLLVTLPLTRKQLLAETTYPRP